MSSSRTILERGIDGRDGRCVIGGASLQVIAVRERRREFFMFDTTIIV